MKWLLVLSLLLPASLHAQGTSEAEQFREPPFWLPIYRELHAFDEEQREYYLSRLAPMLKQIPSLNELSPSEINDAPDWEENWKRIQTRFYRACKWQEKEYGPLCAEAAQLRVKTILMRGNQKAQNRQAESEMAPNRKQGATPQTPPSKGTK